MEISEVDHCIIGGSPVGLTLALLLAKQGKRVAILERNQDLNSIKGGVVIQPKTLELFEHMGILKKLENVSEKILGVVEYAGQETLFDAMYSSNANLKHPFALGISNTNLQESLLSLVALEKNIVLYPNTSIQNLRETTPNKYEVVADFSGELKVIKSELIFACDGKFSKTREMAGIKAEIEEFDQVSVIMKIKRPKNWSAKIRLYHGNNRLFAIPLKDNYLYLIYLKSKKELDALKGLSMNPLINELINLEPELKEGLATINTWDSVLSIPFYSAKPEKWRNRNVVLVGDSAHAVHVYGGQGMNMALLDCTLLARLCEEVQDYGLVGKQFEEIRKPFITEFQDKQQLYLDNSNLDDLNKSIYADNFSSLVIGQSLEIPIVINR
ncbi:NAD(P)/FAD-dependent oxidoreductase [Bacillus sp. SRB1LM]|uniref:FAD-dependent oxidoreductase n=1 Tax=Bacillus sp. SRB1LM TaxID=2608688 RepID=UPI0018C40753|nr:NAD(P)/FAD-dependent oxidoreductase [Bacillus sp. SRB1LM]MBG0967144.1 FAD-dependent monooxygenase [Bacillus sp. SRB1LM]